MDKQELEDALEDEYTSCVSGVSYTLDTPTAPVKAATEMDKDWAILNLGSKIPKFREVAQHILEGNILEAVEKSLQIRGDYSRRNEDEERLKDCLDASEISGRFFGVLNLCERQGVDSGNKGAVIRLFLDKATESYEYFLSNQKTECENEVRSLEEQIEELKE